MKAMVIYDSGFGNTAKIAQAIHDGLSNGADKVELRHVGEVKPEQLQGLDVLIIGSPTQRCRPTPVTNEFLDSIPHNALEGIRVAGFDTRFTEEKIDSMGFIISKMLNFMGYAAKPISDKLAKKGGELVMPPEAFYVDDTEGPLLAGELERAAQWTEQILMKI
jgi:menaquinone-dependent protoporphyrinogen IX oxidase